MSKQQLKPGDIIRHRNEQLGMVMRNDEDGLLVAYPQHDELAIESTTQVRFVTTIEERAK
jgi:hypothetical protein